jgi:type IX secretion system PorP/SprF family membrane protein
MFTCSHIKIYILFFICTDIFHIANGQDVHYSNPNENLFNLNPSCITQIEKSALNLNYRNQWPGGSNFLTYSAAFFSTFSNLKSTVGMQIMRDDMGNGIISLTKASLLYGYETKVSKSMNLSAGLGGSYNIYSIDINRLTFENNITPVSLTNDKVNYFDFLAGMELGILNESWFGLSISHLTSPQISSEFNIFRKYTFSYRGSYNLFNNYSSKKAFIEPVFLSSFQHNNNEVLYGGRINYTGFLGGVYLRNDFNFKFDSFIILLGISLKKITIIYTYDINLSGSHSSFSKLASHEVTFFYNLEYNSRSNKKGAIKCPKF